MSGPSGLLVFDLLILDGLSVFDWDGTLMGSAITGLSAVSEVLQSRNRGDIDE